MLLLLCCAATLGAAVPLPTPTSAQLEWQDFEVGALVQWNIGIFGELSDDYACSSGALPAESFAPTALDTDAWAAAAKGFGAKYAVLTVQAGCGFLLYPTNSTVPGGGVYPYTTANASAVAAAPDIVARFVASCRKAGVRPGIYYQIANNVFCAVKACVVQPPGGAGPCGDQAAYEATTLAQLEELWTRYGELAELWFDGGVDTGVAPTPGTLGAKVAALIAAHQPLAAAFQAPPTPNAVRWVGTEGGTTAADTWSTAKSATDFGPGEPGGPVWAPAECDVTLQANGEWYWQAGVPLRTLAQLAAIYEGCVGHNGNLLLAVHPNLDGGIDPAHAARGAELAAWVEGCFGAPSLLNATAGALSLALHEPLILELPPGAVARRAVLQEDQTRGQLVRGFTLEARVGGAWRQVLAGEAMGHKRIVPLGEGDAAAAADALRLTITAVAGGANAMSLRRFAAFACPPAAAPAAAPAKPLVPW